MVTAQAVPRNTLNEQLASARNEVPATTQQRESQTSSPSRYFFFSAYVSYLNVHLTLTCFISFACSILQKASTAMEVLKEVLDAVDSQNPEVCNVPP